MAKIYVGDVGTVLKINMLEDISTATVKRIDYIKPDETTGSWTPILSGTDYLEYSMVDGDLDQAGSYSLQVYIEIGDFKGLSDTTGFTVYPVWG